MHQLGHRGHNRDVRARDRRARNLCLQLQSIRHVSFPRHCEAERGRCSLETLIEARSVEEEQLSGAREAFNRRVAVDAGVVAERAAGAQGGEAHSLAGGDKGAVDAQNKLLARAFAPSLQGKPSHTHSVISCGCPPRTPKGQSGAEKTGRVRIPWGLRTIGHSDQRSTETHRESMKLIVLVASAVDTESSSMLHAGKSALTAFRTSADGVLDATTTNSFPAWVTVTLKDMNS